MTQDEILKFLFTIASSSLIAGVVTALVNNYLNERRDKKKELEKHYSEKFVVLETYLVDLSNVLDKMFRIWTDGYLIDKIIEKPDYIEAEIKLNGLLDRFTEMFILNTPYIDFGDNSKNLRVNIRNMVDRIHHYGKFYDSFENDGMKAVMLRMIFIDHLEIFGLIRHINESLNNLRFGNSINPVVIRTNLSQIESLKSQPLESLKSRIERIEKDQKWN
jgi:hypothetical protein